MGEGMTPRFYEFFAGAGLARAGLEPHWTCAWANDISAKKALVYRHNFGGDHLVVADVASVDPRSLPAGVDLAWASFPCQDLSLAGWRRGMQARRSGAFWAFWRLMAALHDRGRRPKIIVIENVVGLLSGDHLTGLCDALAALGLTFGALVIDAKYFVSQSRPRVFIVAVDPSIPVAPFVDDRAPAGSLWAPAVLRKAYDALPEHLRGLWRWWRLPAPPRHGGSFTQVYEPLPDADPRWHSVLETQRLLGMMTETNLEKVRIAVRMHERVVGTLYRRIRDGVQRAEVRFDGTAGCLRTPAGGSSRQTVLVVEEDGRVRSRLLTPREAARLMGAPETFWLPPNYNDAYRAMGDGVVAPVVSWLSERLLAPIAAVEHAPQGDDDDVRDGRGLAAHRERAEVLAAQWERVKSTNAAPLKEKARV